MNPLSLFVRRPFLHGLPLIVALLPLIGAPGSSRAIVLQDSDFLISSGQLLVAEPGRLPTVVSSGGLLSPAFLAPSPIVARSGEVAFLNDSTSSLLALRQSGTIRFVSASNLLADPGGVVGEAGGGTYLVASRGAANPGLVRVTDAGAPSPRSRRETRWLPCERSFSGARTTP